MLMQRRPREGKASEGKGRKKKRRKRPEWRESF